MTIEICMACGERLVAALPELVKGPFGHVRDTARQTQPDWSVL
jgi:hypothetical protein